MSSSSSSSSKTLFNVGILKIVYNVTNINQQKKKKNITPKYENK